MLVVRSARNANSLAMTAKTAELATIEPTAVFVSLDLLQSSATKPVRREPTAKGAINFALAKTAESVIPLLENARVHQVFKDKTVKMDALQAFSEKIVTKFVRRGVQVGAVIDSLATVNANQDSSVLNVTFLVLIIPTVQTAEVSADASKNIPKSAMSKQGNASVSLASMDQNASQLVLLINGVKTAIKSVIVLLQLCATQQRENA